MNGIDHLLRDHEQFQPKIQALRDAADDLAKRGDAALADAVPVLVGFGRFMETTLALHARKEDDALFPAVEDVLGPGSGPTPVMREEHIEIHGKGADFRKVLEEVEVDHPVIEQKGEELRQIDTAAGDAETLRSLAEEIVALIVSHFDKEEQMLFPMCRDLLTDEILDDVGRQMEEMAAVEAV
jgi:regulator of cell morphogenesis and NO signaling